MARPTPLKLTVTTAEANTNFGVGITAIHVKNQGNTDCLIDFDNATSANSYLLEAGETLFLENRFIRLYYKTNVGTTTLYIIKEQQ